MQPQFKRVIAFSNEVVTGSREENASNQEARALKRFNETMKDSRHDKLIRAAAYAQMLSMRDEETACQCDTIKRYC